MKESEEHWIAKLRQAEGDLLKALDRHLEAAQIAAGLHKHLNRSMRLNEALLELLDTRNKRIDELNAEVLELNKSCQEAHDAHAHLVAHAYAQSKPQHKYTLLGFIEKPNGRTVHDLSPANGRAVYVREYA